MSDLISRADAIALAEARAEAWAKATYATEDGRLQNAARVYAAYDIVADLRALPAVEVGVKPLEWVKHPTADIWRCDSLIGTYKAFGVGVSPSWDFDDYVGKTQRSSIAPTIEAAKAAAQSDYVARIRSALTVTPALDLAKVQALVDAVQAYIDRSEDYQIIATDRGGTRGPKGKAFIAVGDAYADLRAALAAMKDGK